MFQTLKNAFKIPELRKKIFFTLFIILLYRVGSVIPVPFVDGQVLDLFANNPYFSGDQGGIFALLNTFSGGALSQATLFALGVQIFPDFAEVRHSIAAVRPLRDSIQEGHQVDIVDVGPLQIADFFPDTLQVARKIVDVEHHAQ